MSCRCKHTDPDHTHTYKLQHDVPTPYGPLIFLGIIYLVMISSPFWVPLLYQVSLRFIREVYFALMGVG